MSEQLTTNEDVRRARAGHARVGQRTGRLIAVVQDLSLARTLAEVQTIVRTAARELTDADGATFVLRDNGQCFYADEDAIAPLWKGLRFPMEACISGWVMLHKERAIIPDIYADARIPTEAYRPTFVKSLVMMPIRTTSPIGAIGAYWARHHEATREEVELLQALADSTSMALENLQVYAELESRIAERTADLVDANARLVQAQDDKRRVTDMIVHDLQNPVAGISAALQVLRQRARKGDTSGAEPVFERALHSCEELSEMIHAVLQVSEAETGRLVPRHAIVDLAALVRDAVDAFASAASLSEHELRVLGPERLEVRTDARLVRRVVQNLVRNALRHTPVATHVEVRLSREAGDCVRVCVADDGPGIAPELHDTIFEPFGAAALYGRGSVDTGLGLPTCRMLARALGGELTVVSDGRHGTEFVLVLPADAAE